jgi:hypothetical protein
MPAAPGSDLITNANAPVVEIKIILDNRYTPPKLAMTSNMDVPGIVVMNALHDCQGQLLKMQMMAEASNAEAARTNGTGEFPDLPTAPPNFEKPV